MGNITVKTYAPPEINLKEILRYAGCKNSNEEIKEIVDFCIKASETKIKYRVCFEKFPISIKSGYIDLGFAETYSKKLTLNLEGCDSIILFAATLGMEFEALLRKTSIISPINSLFMHALGDERIESLCDTFNRDINDIEKSKGNITKPRFSPGYGDLKLELQKDIIKILNCTANLGITLDNNYFMTPSKSVTAIIGIKPQKG